MSVVDGISQRDSVQQRGREIGPVSNVSSTMRYSEEDRCLNTLRKIFVFIWILPREYQGLTTQLANDRDALEAHPTAS